MINLKRLCSWEKHILKRFVTCKKKRKRMIDLKFEKKTKIQPGFRVEIHFCSI